MTDSKRELILAKVEKSQATLDAESAPHQVPLLRDAVPPEKFSSLIAEYPGAAIGAGLILGVMVGALLPRSAGRKLAQRSTILAAAAGEIGIALSKQVLEKAGEAGKDSREKLGELGESAVEAGRKAADAGRKAGGNAARMAGDASHKARDLGLIIVRKAIEAALKVRH